MALRLSPVCVYSPTCSTKCQTDVQRQFQVHETGGDQHLNLSRRLERISERSATEVESHRLFKGEANGRKVSYTWTHLDVGERGAQRLAVPEDVQTPRG